MHECGRWFVCVSVWVSELVCVLKVTWKLLMCTCSFCSTWIIVSVYSCSLHCTMQHTLTSLLCSHSHFFTKVSYSILVCCSHRHIVGRVGHQTNDIIRHCHPSRNSKCSIKDLIHIIRRVYSSILYLISGKTVVMGWTIETKWGNKQLVYTLYINHVRYALQLPVESDSEVVILPHFGNSQHEKQHIALIAMYVNIHAACCSEKEN